MSKNHFISNQTNSKSILSKKGWTEISYVNIEASFSIPIFLVKDLINIDFLIKDKFSSHCSCCKNKWENINEMSPVYAVIANSEPTIVCSSCFGKFKLIDDIDL